MAVHWNPEDRTKVKIDTTNRIPDRYLHKAKDDFAPVKKPFVGMIVATAGELFQKITRKKKLES